MLSDVSSTSDVGSDIVILDGLIEGLDSSEVTCGALALKDGRFADRITNAVILGGLAESADRCSRDKLSCDRWEATSAILSGIRYVHTSAVL